MEDIRTITTTCGELQYTIVDDGFIKMINPKTISRYYQLRWETQPDLTGIGIFFAFSNEQLEQGIASLKKRGFITDASELRRSFGGAFGSAESIRKMYAAYNEIEEKIKAECDPQEVYFYEFNNHETPYGWDGDIEIMKIIVGTWGYDVAIGLKRYCKSNDSEIQKLNKN